MSSRSSPDRSFHTWVAVGWKAAVRSGWTLVAIMALSLVLSSCAAQHRSIAVGDVFSAGRAPSEPLRVSGYTTSDSEFHAFDGQVVSAGPDSLEFFAEYRPGTQVREERPEERFRVARSEVKSLRLFPGPIRSSVSAIGVLILLGGAALLLLAITGANLFER